VPPGTPVELGDGISLLALKVKPSGDSLRATLYWQAARTPSQNYSVFVHLSDKDSINAPGDMIAQADSEHPVYGWYPTTKWGAGEVVREDYSIQIPAGKQARSLTAGMYTRLSDGTFQNLGQVVIPVERDR
jgi:hypothetical protein